MPPTQDCFTLDQVEEEFEDTKGVIRISKSKDRQQTQWLKEPEALKSLYRSPGYKKNQLVLCKNYVLQW
jgi:hypothetical protein